MLFQCSSSMFPPCSNMCPFFFHHVPSLFPRFFFMVCPCLSISFRMFPTFYYVFEGFAHVFPQPNPYCQLIGLREKIQETTIFPGKIYGFRLRFSLQLIYPRWSTHGIFTNVCPINDPNVVKYAIHWAYGHWYCHRLWWLPLMEAPLSWRNGSWCRGFGRQWCARSRTDVRQKP